MKWELRSYENPWQNPGLVGTETQKSSQLEDSFEADSSLLCHCLPGQEQFFIAISFNLFSFKKKKTKKFKIKKCPDKVTFRPSLYYLLARLTTYCDEIDLKIIGVEIYPLLQTRQKFKSLLDLKKFPARDLFAVLTPSSSQSFEITKKKQDGLD